MKVEVGLFRRRKGKKKQEIGRKEGDEVGDTTHTCYVCVETPKGNLPVSIMAKEIF